MSTRARFRVPTIQNGDQQALDYVKKHFTDTAARRSVMLRMAWNGWMDLGNHWIEPDRTIRAGSETFRFVDVYRNSNKRLPRPVDNMIGEGVKNLVDRVTRKQYEPSPRPDTRTPELEASARLQHDLLLWDLDQAEWRQEIDRSVTGDIVTYGPGFGHSLWDETYEDMMATSATEAQKCVGCGSTFAQPVYEENSLRAWVRGGGDEERLMSRIEQTEGGYKLGACPQCETSEVGKLEPYSPSQEQADAMEPDFFGMPLGQKVPKGEAIWEVPSPFEMYLENGGFIDPKRCKIWGQATVRSMEWIDAHVPPDKREGIAPEDPAELMKHHPTLGHQWFGRSGKAIDENIYANDARVFELTVEPIDSGGEGPEDGLRWGRFIRVICDRVVKNEPLMREVPGSDDGQGKPVRIPVSKYFIGGAKTVRGQCWYRTPVDDARPLNIILNRYLAIQEDIIERGVPLVAIPEGIEWAAKGDQATGAFRMHEYNAAAADGAGGWKPKDALVNPNQGQSNQLQPTIDDIRERIRQQLGPMLVESGDSAGADSALQLQHQAEQARQKLNQIDAARVHIEEGMFQHHADLIWAFRREGGEYEVQNAAGDYEKKSYERNQILEQIKVKLEAKGTTDESLLQTEKAVQAYDRGFYGQPGTQSQETIDDLLELMSLPKLNDAQSIQVKKAKQAWSDFVRESSIPYVDVTIQDTWIWYQVLGKQWQGDEGSKVQEEVGWDQVLRKIAGWERKLAQAEAIDMQQRDLYEGYPTEKWPRIQAEFNAKAGAAAQAAQGMTAVTGQSAPPAPVAPQPPASGQFLPESMCDRLLMLWRGMLGVPDPATVAAPIQNKLDAAQYSLVPEEQAAAEGWQNVKSLDPVLRMYAVIQECRLDSMKKQGVPAAPGGSSTPAGGIPTPGSPVQPAPGVPQATTGVAA